VKRDIDLFHGLETRDKRDNAQSRCSLLQTEVSPEDVQNWNGRHWLVEPPFEKKSHWIVSILSQEATCMQTEIEKRNTIGSSLP
jgi:hypothetical protein